MVSVMMDQIKIGLKGSVVKTISETDVYNYSGITGDFSWLHVDEERSKRGRFGRRIAQGMLSIGLVSAAIGTQMPGTGTIYVSQTIKFLRPVYIGDTITAEVEVIEIMKDRGMVRLKTTCTNQYGEEVLTGEGVVIPPEEI